MTDFLSAATKGVQGLHPYLPGKPVEELERELGISEIVKLASNENPLGPSYSVLDAIKSALADLSRYPDGNGFELKKALSGKLGVDAGQITLGNGSNDVLDLIARTFLNPEDEAIYSQYGFAVYPISIQAAGAKGIQVPAKNWGHDLEAMAAAITDKTKVVFLANPNNPTGTWFAEEDLIGFLEVVPANVVVVLDEAYFEYVDVKDYPNGMSLLERFQNLIVTRTFSKAYGLAGLRVGYAVSCADIANLLNRVRHPFNVNALALVAATAALNDQAYLEKSIELNRSGLAQLASGFNQLGLEYIASIGNFIAVDFKKDAQAINDALLKGGVIVRPIANYGMPEFLRISVGTQAENEKLLAVLSAVLESVSGV